MNLQWFADAPLAGDPACICSHCRQPISQQESPILRWWDPRVDQEIRFHWRCAVYGAFYLERIAYIGEWPTMMTGNGERTRNEQFYEC
jgi:hypothetical protein